MNRLAVRARRTVAQVLGDVRAGSAVVAGVLRPAVRRSPELVVGLGVVLSVLAALVLVGAARNDATIEAHRGRSIAEVLDGSSAQRTFVRFTDADGAVLTPEKGVFYPRGLEPGQLVRVEYDRTQPELVRVEGRNWTVGLVPVLIGIGAVWLVCAPAAWALTRWRRRRRGQPAGSFWWPASGGDAASPDPAPDTDAPDDPAAPMATLSGAGVR